MLRPMGKIVAGSLDGDIFHGGGCEGLGTHTDAYNHNAECDSDAVNHARTADPESQREER